MKSGLKWLLIAVLFHPFNLFFSLQCPAWSTDWRWHKVKQLSCDFAVLNLSYIVHTSWKKYFFFIHLRVFWVLGVLRLLSVKIPSNLWVCTVSSLVQFVLSLLSPHQLYVPGPAGLSLHHQWESGWSCCVCQTVEQRGADKCRPADPALLRRCPITWWESV